MAENETSKAAIAQRLSYAVVSLGAWLMMVLKLLRYNDRYAANDTSGCFAIYAPAILIATEL